MSPTIRPWGSTVCKAKIFLRGVRGFVPLPSTLSIFNVKAFSFRLAAVRISDVYCCNYDFTVFFFGFERGSGLPMKAQHHHATICPKNDFVAIVDIIPQSFFLVHIWTFRFRCLICFNWDQIQQATTELLIFETTNIQTKMQLLEGRQKGMNVSSKVCTWAY